jgi:hypothetical protein
MKKYVIGAFALILAISFSAFIPKGSTNTKKATTTEMWFDFTGSSVADYDNPDLYTQDPTHADPCSGSGLRCEILAPVIESGPDAGKPDLNNISAETLKP